MSACRRFDPTHGIFNMPDTPTVRRLVAELAVAMSQFLQQSLAHEADEHGFMFHSYQGPFDEGSFILWELGAALGAPATGAEGVTFEDWDQNRSPHGLLPGGFKFAPVERTRALVMAHTEFAPSLINRLLEAYLRSMLDYSWRGSRLDQGREPFEPAPVFLPQIDCLVECGYLVRSGATVRWTDKIGPAMQAAGQWDGMSVPPKPVAIELSAQTRARVEALLLANRRVEVVKVIRDATGVGLVEAKAHMEAMVNELVRHQNQER